MTKKKLQAIKKRLKNVGTGQWEMVKGPYTEELGRQIYYVQIKSASFGILPVATLLALPWNSEQIANFMFHSREDIPALLAYIEELEAKVAEHQG